MGTNRHFKRKQEEMNALATAALAGVVILRGPTSTCKGQDFDRWYVYMPDGSVFTTETKLIGAKLALNKLEMPL